MSSDPQPITCLAAVAWQPKQPLDITEITVAPPQIHEVRLKVLSNALCHTDVYTLEGFDSEGLFPCILGHEAVSIVESVGPEVTSVEVGDMVIPCYTPECQDLTCVFCMNPNTNLCPKIRATQGKGVMPDGTSRFSKEGKIIYHFMGCSTFSEYTVVAEISVAKISKLADPYKVCLLGCGVSTGWGAVYNTAKVSAGSTVVIFGLGAVGMAVVQACKQVGARYIVGVDIHIEKFERAKKLGCDDCFCPLSIDMNIKELLLTKEKWGFGFTFDCTGNVDVMRTALEVAHRGFGVSCIIGVAAAGHEIQTRPFQLVTGRTWTGTAFGGWKSRSEVPRLVRKVLREELALEPFITHNLIGLNKVNEALELETTQVGKCLRAVIHIAEHQPNPINWNFHLVSKNRSFAGEMMRFTHWSEVCKCEMHFSIYIPDKRPFKDQKSRPVLYFLAGITGNDETAPTKSGFQKYASEQGIVVVCPDTSPRGINIEGVADDWDFGVGAGFYLDATREKYSEHFNMGSYLTKELPYLLNEFFEVDLSRQGVMGHSMGGHGALVTFLRNPGKYISVSAIAPICNPINCPWGIKAFNGYLGDVTKGKEYDACELMKDYKGNEVRILIDQGSGDKFLKDQLKPWEFTKVCYERKYPINFRMHEQYDHSYYFIASVIEEHFKLHAKNFGI